MSSSASSNHIFRTLWSKALGVMVAVAEISSGRGQSSGTSSRRSRYLKSSTAPRPRLRNLPLCIAIGWMGLASSALANPVGGVAIVGQSSMVTQGNQSIITTQNGAGANHSAINWQSFSIAAGNTAYFHQPSASSTVINRVVTNTPSLIFGTLGSNGNLVLVNQSGIAVGAGAVVDTAGFTASSLRMSDADALTGRLRFGDGSASGSGVSVQGSILAKQGDVVVLSSNIETGKEALIQAPNGSILLAAGQQIELTGRGLEGIFLQVQAPPDKVVNLGKLTGDAVGVFAGTLKHSGQIQATAVSLEGGRVVLKALDQLEVDGGVRAQALAGAGGVVHATGRQVRIGRSAVVDVSGSSGGGEALIGGGWHGEDARITNAQQTVVATGAQIKADATDSGNGGTAVVWADGATHFGGSVSARGGVKGGNGGRAEVSGKQYLDFRGAADLSAPLGQTGTLLLDPDTLTIGSVDDVDESGGSYTTDDISDTDYSGKNSQILASTVSSLLNNNNLSLAAKGDVTVVANIAKTTGGANTLTLASTEGDIILNASISGTPSSPLYLSLSTGSFGSVSFKDNSSLIFGDVTTGTLDVDTSDGAGTGTASITQASGTSIKLGIGSVFKTDKGNVTLENSNNELNSIAVISAGQVSVRDAGSFIFLDEITADALKVQANNIYSYGYSSSITTSVGGLDMTATDSIDLIDLVTLVDRPIISAGPVQLKAGGYLAIGRIDSSATGDAVFLSADKDFDSSYGETIATNNGRWLAYLNFIPGGCTSCGGPHDFGVLVPEFKQYNYTNGAPIMGSGSGIVYANATPAVLNAALTGSVSKVYDTGLGISLSGTAFGSISGAIDGDDFSNSYFSDGAANLDNKNVGASKLVTASGMSISVNSGGFTVGPMLYGYLTSASGNVGAVTAKNLTVNGSLPVSKVYDGTTAATAVVSLSTASGSGSTSDGTVYSGDDVSLSGTAVAKYNSKNVLEATSVSFTGLALAGAQAGNYTLTAGAQAATITPYSLSVKGVGVADKVYDGSTSATLSAPAVVPALGSDQISLSNTGIGVFADKNVATGKTVTVSGYTLGGVDASNYLVEQPTGLRADITVRANSNWTGGAGNNSWRATSNWDFLPDGSNVLAVSIPAGASVVYDLTSPTNLATLTSSGALTIAGGSLVVSSRLTTPQYIQTAGALSGTGSLKVNGSFSQTGGTIAMGGRVEVTQNAGTLDVGSISAQSINLVAKNGNIMQSAALVTSGLLTTQSLSGTVLNEASNRIGSFNAASTGSGNIELTNVGALDVLGIYTANGNITLVNSGGVTTTGAIKGVNGSVSMTANNAIDGDMLLNGSISSTDGSVTLNSARNFEQNSAIFGVRGVTVNAGSSITLGPLATAARNPVIYNTNGKPVSKPPLPAPTLQELQSSAVLDFVTVFSKKLEEALLVQDSTTDDPIEKKNGKAAVVAEGFTCKR